MGLRDGITRGLGYKAQRVGKKPDGVIFTEVPSVSQVLSSA